MRIRYVANMKVKLEFTAKAQTPRLVCVSFWANGKEKLAVPSAMIVGAGQISHRTEKDRVFHWRAGARSLAILLLEAYARGKPFSGKLQGDRDSPAYSLAQALKEANKEGMGRPFWIHDMFTACDSPNATREKWQLPDSMFVRFGNQDKDVDNYWVELGSEWQKAQLVALQGSHQLTATEAITMAREILSQFDAAKRVANQQQPRNQLPALRCQVRLSCIKDETGPIIPIEASRLPLPVNHGVRLSMSLGQPAYPYVAWITGAGVVQPLYPWRNFNWKEIGNEPARVELSLPDAQLPSKSGFYPLESEPGVEVAIMLGTRKPLEPKMRCGLEAMFNRCIKHIPKALPDPTKYYLLTDRRGIAGRGPSVRLGAPHPTDDPLGQLSEGLISLIGYAVPCIAGIAFSTQAILK